MTNKQTLSVCDCLYLIHKGTVAIYFESDKEVCHLDDGDFFGEIALIMKHRSRTASAVAVTNCELFQLDREDFESSVASYPTVYEDIKKIATQIGKNDHVGRTSQERN